MENLEKGSYNLLFSNLLSIINTVVGVVSIAVTLYSVVPRKDKQQKSNRHSAKK